MGRDAQHRLRAHVDRPRYDSYRASNEVDAEPRMGVDNFLTDRVTLSPSRARLTALREGQRATLCDGQEPNTLAYLLSGQLPYFYRSPAKIAAEFAARHHALEMLADIAIKLPSHPKFQQSHCGEILAALYLEEVLGLTRLYCKLSLVTSENTNVHKMDGFFVDIRTTPFTYYAVEAKCSVQPTGRSRFSGHRYGILRQLIHSLDSYTSLDKRFDLSLVRDHLENENFTADQQTTIRRDLIPPGPTNLVYLGTASINQSTVCQKDDDYILSTPCSQNFSFYCIAVSDIKHLATSSYARVLSLIPSRSS